MAVTTTEIHRVLKEISAKLDLLAPASITIRQRGPQIDLTATNSLLTSILARLNAVDFATDASVDGLEALLTTIDADTSILAAVDFALDASVDGIEALLTTIDADTSILALVDFALDASVDGIEAKLDTIDDSVQDVEGNTGLLGVNTLANIANGVLLVNIENEIDNVEETIERRFQFQYDTSFEVTSIAGGTIAWYTFQPGAGNAIREFTISVIADTMTNASGVELTMRDGTGNTALENRHLGTVTIGSIGLANGAMWPDKTVALEMHESGRDKLINTEALHIRVTALTVGDIFRISIRGNSKESTGTGTISTANSTATITDTQVRKRIDTT